MAKENQKNKFTELVPPLLEIEGRFLFIEDDILRQNIAISLQYILLLIAILDKENANDTILASSLNKNMIVNVAVITEGCLHYCLRQLIGKGIIEASNIMPVTEKFKDCKVLHKIKEGEDVCGAIRIREHEIFDSKTSYQNINRAAKKAGILNEVLFGKSEDLRKQRNKIHVAGLEVVDNTYKKSTVNLAMRIMADIVGRVGSILIEPSILSNKKQP